jgi:hypothetical protein
MTLQEAGTIRTDVPARPSAVGPLALDGARGPRHGPGAGRRVAFDYDLGAAVMILGGLFELVLGVDAEQKSPEELGEPLSARRE